MLNQAQGALAAVVDPTLLSPKKNSLRWRQMLDVAGKDTASRQAHADSLLATKPLGSMEALVQSTDVMYLICKKESSIRVCGDRVAHPNVVASPDDLQRLQVSLGNLNLSDNNEKKGMERLIGFYLQKNTEHT